ncbi:MAG: TonB-dependent receptor, partial [Pseudomonadota bacterium]
GHGRRPEVIAYEASLFDNAVLAENFKTVEAEETDAYEIGLRGALFDGVLSGELVGYYYEYTNFQSTVVRDGRAVPENAGNASGPGFETAFAVRPAPWASYFFTYAYNGVEFDDKGTDGAPQLRAGNQFRLSPKHAFTAAAEFVWDCGCGTLKFVPSFTYRSEIFFDDNNDIAFDPNGDPNTQLQGATPLIRPGGDQFQDEVEPGYNIVDLRVRYTPNWDDTLEIEAFIENVFDEEYILDAGNTGDIFGIPTFISGVPQMYGVYLSKSF